MSDIGQGMEARMPHNVHPVPALYTHGHVHPHNMPHGPMAVHHHAAVQAVQMGGHSEGGVEAEGQSHMDHGNMHLRFLDNHGEENGFGDDDGGDDDNAGDEDGLEEAEMHSDGGNPGDMPSSFMVHSQLNTQLSLSYQGEVYVFDSVPPEKVQAVLLLLGGREIPAGMSNAAPQIHHQSKGMPEIPQRLNLPDRLASLSRFRAKRKERNFDKKIRYLVRKEVAVRMHRNKGQFAPAKPASNEGCNLPNQENSDNLGYQNGGGGEGEARWQDIKCLHCGIEERSTPMMRRGPSGPRTLCNACGLMWANKGVLRDLTKPPNAAGTAQQNLMHS